MVTMKILINYVKNVNTLAFNVKTHMMNVIVALLLQIE